MGLSVFLLILGLPCTFMGGLAVRQQTRLRRKGVRVMGTVTRFETGASSSGVSYTPVVRFSTQAGKEVESGTRVEMPWKRPPVGTVVPLIYDRANPDLVEIDTWARRGLETVFGLLMLLAGVAMMVVGIVRLIQG